MGELVNIDKKKPESSMDLNKTSEKTTESPAPARRARRNAIVLPRSPLAPQPDKYASAKESMTGDQVDNFSEKTEEDKEKYIKASSGLNDDETKMYNLENLTDLDSLLGTVILNSAENAKGQLLADAMKVSNDKLGLYGSSFWSTNVGNKLRVLMKDSARALAFKWVDAEFDKQKSELAPGDKVKEEALERTKIFVKANLYKSIKTKLAEKLNQESVQIANGVLLDVDTLLQNNIKYSVKTSFLKDVQKNVSKDKKGDPRSRFNSAKTKALEDAYNNSESVGSSIYKLLEKKVKAQADVDSTAKLDELFVKFLGQSSSEKMDFSKVDMDTFKGADYVFGDGATDGGESEGATETKTEVKNQLKGQEIVAPDLNKGLKVYSTLMMNSAPFPGDSMEASAALKIPVDELVTLNIKIGGEAERESDNYCTSKITSTVGVSVGRDKIAKVTGEIGGYMETKAKTPENMALLISYGMYRNARESSSFPTSLTDAIWGFGGKTGESSYKEAEAFGANAESFLFGGKPEDDENEVTLGKVGKLALELGDVDSGLGGEIGLSYERGRKYSKDSFENGAGKDRLGKMEGYKFMGQDSKGDRVQNISLEGMLGFKYAKGKMGAQIAINRGEFESFELTGSFSLAIPGTSVATKVTSIIAESIEAGVAHGTKLSKHANSAASKRMGGTDSKLGDMYESKAQLAQSSSGEIAQIALTSMMGEASLGLSDLLSTKSFQVGFKYVRENGENKLTIAIKSVTTSKIELGIFEAEYVKARTLYSKEF